MNRLKHLLLAGTIVPALALTPFAGASAQMPPKEHAPHPDGAGPKGAPREPHANGAPAREPHAGGAQRGEGGAGRTEAGQRPEPHAPAAERAPRPAPGMKAEKAPTAPAPARTTEAPTAGAAAAPDRAERQKGKHGHDKAERAPAGTPDAAPTTSPKTGADDNAGKTGRQDERQRRKGARDETDRHDSPRNGADAAKATPDETGAPAGRMRRDGTDNEHMDKRGGREGGRMGDGREGGRMGDGRDGRMGDGLEGGRMGDGRDGRMGGGREGGMGDGRDGRMRDNAGPGGPRDNRPDDARPDDRRPDNGRRDDNRRIEDGRNRDLRDDRGDRTRGDRGIGPGGAAAIGAAAGFAGGFLAATGAQRLDEIRRDRRETVEGGRTFIREPGRTIVEDGGRSFIVHDENDRFRQLGMNVRRERRGNDTVDIVERPGGVQILTFTTPDGRLLRRVRRGGDGREVVLIDNGFDGRVRPVQDDIVVLPPPPLRIPRDRYVVDYHDADPGLIYDTLVAPPLAAPPRRYTLDQIRYSPDVRNYVRSVDINTINFETGSWTVPGEATGKLRALADAINKAIDRNPRSVFMVEGFTDATGNPNDNLSLSDRRAQSVAAILTKAFNVPPENLTTQGYGQQNPKEDTQGPSAANRRVVVQNITPLLASGGQ